MNEQISTTYDVSTPDVPADPARHYAPEPDTGSLDFGLDTLDLLRERADEVAATEIRSTTVANAADSIRLVCRGNISMKELQRWNRKALPPVARKNPGAGGYEPDGKVLHTAVLSETAERIEVKDRNGEWRVVEDAAEHRPLTFADDALLRAFGALDATTALVRIFGRESDLVKAGITVLTGAGWAEGATGYEGDEDLDPMD